MILLILIIGLYVWFRCAMWYRRHLHELREKRGLVYYFYIAALTPGFILDVLLNWTVGLVLGWIPVLTLSRKLKYIRSPQWSGPTWRLRFADWMCEEILNKWAPNHKHC